MNLYNRYQCFLDASLELYEKAKPKMVGPFVLNMLVFCLYWLETFIGEKWVSYKWVLSIDPGKLTGLLGLFTAPFTHLNEGHLVNNLLILIPLSFLVSFTNTKFTRLVLTLVLISGLFVYLFSSMRVIGASGLTYALFAFVLTQAWLRLILLSDVRETGFFDRSLIVPVSVLILTFILGAYLAHPLAQLKPNISVVAHSTGCIAGILVALYVVDQEVRQMPKEARE